MTNEWNGTQRFAENVVDLKIRDGAGGSGVCLLTAERQMDDQGDGGGTSLRLDQRGRSRKVQQIPVLHFYQRQGRGSRAGRGLCVSWDGEAFFFLLYPSIRLYGAVSHLFGSTNHVALRWWAEEMTRGGGRGVMHSDESEINFH